MSDSAWLVRRVKTVTGHPVQRPKIWGKVFASSETVAVQKFIWLLNVQESPSHFEAVPHGGR